MNAEPDPELVEQMRREQIEILSRGAAADRAAGHVHPALNGLHKIEKSVARLDWESRRRFAQGVGASFDEPPPEEAAPNRTIPIRSGLEILADPVAVHWLLRPYLEENILALLYGELGTLKSFLALHWAMLIATAGKAVLYLSAEGKGLDRRLRGWCLKYAPDRPADEFMATVPFLAVEQALQLPQVAVLDTLERSIDALGVTPALVVVDTLARYGGALDENKAQDVAVLIGAADRLRQRYNATVLLVHHVGHAAKDRARGSYALMAATDAHFLLERPDPNEMFVTMTTGRLKDSESPPPLRLEAQVMQLGYVDEDEKPVSTLILQSTDRVILPAKRMPTGRNVADALAALRTHDSAVVMTLRDINEAIRSVIPDRRRRAEAITWLQQNRWLVPTVGGLRLEI